VQIAAYNFHLGLLHPEPFWLEPKVYSARCEADVLMSSPTVVSTSLRLILALFRRRDVADYPNPLWMAASAWLLRDMRRGTDGKA